MEIERIGIDSHGETRVLTCPVEIIVSDFREMKRPSRSCDGENILGCFFNRPGGRGEDGTGPGREGCVRVHNGRTHKLLRLF